jgi:hypothetical protein
VNALVEFEGVLKGTCFEQNTTSLPAGALRNDTNPSAERVAIALDAQENSVASTRRVNEPKSFGRGEKKAMKKTWIKIRARWVSYHLSTRMTPHLALVPFARRCVHLALRFPLQVLVHAAIVL